MLVHGYIDYNLLKNQGVNDDLILIFYDARIKNNFFKKIKKLNRVLNMRVWAWEFFKFVLNYDFSHRLSKRDDFRRWVEIKRDIRYIKKNGLYKKIVLMGVNKFSEFYVKEIKDKIAFIIDEKHAGENINGVKVTGYDEILSLNPNDYYYYFFDRLTLRKQQGNLIELGVSDSLIFWGGRTRTGFVVGTGLQDAFDPLIGYARNESGFTIFSNSDDDYAFKIVTLGGSTSDPKLENIKSWSEFLFEKLDKIGMKVKIYAGGVGGYSAAQECLKFIRDVLVISPDLVLSYSGVNDMFATEYDVENHYFVRYYYPALINKMLNKGYIRNTVSANIRVKHLVLGLHDPSDKSEFWIKCEQIMNSVCNGFGIDFHGCLQAVFGEYLGSADTKEEEAKKFLLYEKCKKLVNENNFSWLHDMTGIFDGNKDVYYDFCHVHEKGNRIIAQNMLPFVLESYNKRKGKL